MFNFITVHGFQKRLRIVYVPDYCPEEDTQEVQFSVSLVEELHDYMFEHHSLTDDTCTIQVGKDSAFAGSTPSDSAEIASEEPPSADTAP